MRDDDEQERQRNDAHAADDVSDDFCDSGFHVCLPCVVGAEAPCCYAALLRL